MYFLVFQTDGLCKNDGECRPNCDELPFYQCACTSEWEGHNCTIKVSVIAGGNGATTFSITTLSFVDKFCHTVCYHFYCYA
jgi:hypothetical protein